MQYTSNFNFNLPEGTDLWNYLTQTNPNFTALDTLLKSIQDGTVTSATEVTSGTAHAVTRTLPDANVIRFTATGVWTLGDTMTIDGTPVTVVKPNGTSLQTGDYIIGSEVLGVLRATQFTVYVGGVSSLDASDVTYDNTGSGLTATDVQDAIDEVNSNLSWELLHSETSDGVKSLGQILYAFEGYVNYDNNYEYMFTFANNIFNQSLGGTTGVKLQMYSMRVDYSTGNPVFQAFRIADTPSLCTFKEFNSTNSSISDVTSTVYTAGSQTFKLYRRKI